MSRFSDAVNAQIASCSPPSQQYTAIAVHYDAGTLRSSRRNSTGRRSRSEMDAMMLVQYLLDIGATVAIRVCRSRRRRSPTIARRSSWRSSRSGP